MKNSLKIRSLFLVLVLMFIPGLIFAAGSKEPALSDGGRQSGEVQQAKYVFLFIGDGMALPQINSAEIFTNALSGKDINIQKLGFTKFPVSGATTTFDAGSFITDSASAGTAIASGNKTLNGVINMDPGKKVKYKTIAEYAKEAGMKVGVVSNVSLDHATPASFYAKVPSRGNMYDIAVQLSQSNFDFFGGGGFAQPTGKNKDQPSAIDMMKAAGYTYVNSKTEFTALKSGAGKVVAVNAVLQDSNAMPYDIDRKGDDLSLADYTKKAIELLSDGEKGFFLMVEAGKIDWACHANDAASSIKDTIAFDKAIAEAVAFYTMYPEETLIVVTGDHETGGMTIGFAGTKYDTFFNKIASQKGSYRKFDEEILKPYKASTKGGKLEDILPVIEDYFGLSMAMLTEAQKEQLQRSFERSMGNEIERSVTEDQYLLYGGYEPLTVKCTHLVNQLAGIGWTSYAHTGVPVATFALGAGQEVFGGYYDNTDIFRKLATVMKINAAVAALR